jgi:hypothetical protein
MIMAFEKKLIDTKLQMKYNRQKYSTQHQTNNTQQSFDAYCFACVCICSLRFKFQIFDAQPIIISFCSDYSWLEVGGEFRQKRAHRMLTFSLLLMPTTFPP